MEEPQLITEDDCIRHLEHLRWNGIITSPFVASSKVYVCANKRYKCYDTGKYFNVKTNTLFHNTRVELRTWFQAIEIFLKGEVTSVSLANQLGIPQKTAWIMLRKLRKYYPSENATNLKTHVSVGKSEGKLNLLQWLNRIT